MPVIDIRTRRPIEPAPDNERHHQRLMGLLRSFIVGAEAHGVPWVVIEKWLSNQLAYVHAKIVQQQNGTKR